MKKLLFCRSYSGSFSFKGKNSFFYSGSAPSVRLPITLELAFSRGIDPDSGMSASLPEMNSLWLEFQQKQTSILFPEPLEFYKTAKNFFSSQTQDFKELRISFLGLELVQSSTNWQCTYKSAKYFQLPEVSSEVFYSPMEMVFEFSKEEILKSFLEGEILNLQGRIKNSSPAENPFSWNGHLEKIGFDDPRTGNHCELDKALSKSFWK